MEKRSEIRIIDPDKKLHERVRQRAKENKRTIGKEAEYMIEQYMFFIDSGKQLIKKINQNESKRKVQDI